MKGRAIGGFLPLDSEPTAAGGGVFAHWRATDTNAWMFANARSALVHLVASAGVRRVLLPAYICPALAEAAGSSVEIDFYPLDEELSPNVADLSVRLRPDDCVVGVDYYGRPPSREFRHFAAERPDILWVEDRAQALDTGIPDWADWQLFSPRKLFGVSDGGVLVRRGACLEPAPYDTNRQDREKPRRMRLDDVGERNSAAWYAAYRAIEDAMTLSREPMSTATRARLDRVDVAGVIAKRRANYAFLAEDLSDFTLFERATPTFTPFGFPVRVPARGRTVRRLAERHVYAARYWPHLPSESAIFPTEHALNRELLTLPCDHRYTNSDMETVAAAFRESIE